MAMTVVSLVTVITSAQTFREERGGVIIPLASVFAVWVYRVSAVMPALIHLLRSLLPGPVKVRSCAMHDPYDPESSRLW